MIDRIRALLVVLEEGTQAIFIDEYASPSGEGQALHNGAVELIVGDRSSLTHGGLVTRLDGLRSPLDFGEVFPN